MKSNFSKNLIRIRKSKGLSQEELAKIAGVSRRTITHYENGNVKSHIEIVYSIAKALNVKIEDLLGNSKNNNSDSLLIDSRTMKKIELILSLPKDKRHIIYTIAESLSKQ